MGYSSYNDDINDRRDADAHERPPEAMPTRQSSRGSQPKPHKQGRRKKGVSPQGVPAPTLVEVAQLREQVRRIKSELSKLRAENGDLRAEPD